MYRVNTCLLHQITCLQYKDKALQNVQLKPFRSINVWILQSKPYSCFECLIFSHNPWQWWSSWKFASMFMQLGIQMADSTNQHERNQQLDNTQALSSQPFHWNQLWNYNQTILYTSCFHSLLFFIECWLGYIWLVIDNVWIGWETFLLKSWLAASCVLRGRRKCCHCLWLNTCYECWSDWLRYNCSFEYMNIYELWLSEHFYWFLKYVNDDKYSECFDCTKMFTFSHHFGHIVYIFSDEMRFIHLLHNSIMSMFR